MQIAQTNPEAVEIYCDGIFCAKNKKYNDKKEETADFRGFFLIKTN